METKNQSKLPKFIILNFVALCLYSCTGDPEYVSNGTPPTPLIIDYKIPHDLPVGASQEDIANFAWNHFFALNWKAAWAQDSQNRFIPDKNWTSKDSPPNLSVWETYAHRTELRPANGTISEALETGKPNYTFTNSDIITNNNILINNNCWNVLDEDNEIGSAYLFDNKNESQVLYMAKTNLVEYNYLKDNYPIADKLETAVKKTSKLFGTLTKAQMCDSDGAAKKNVVCLPCGDSTSDDPKNEGVIEIKLAFKKLGKNDTISKFITKEVLVFKKDPKNTGNIIPSLEKMGLIGMHIIHKTKNYPAFIFASFEQVDVRNNNMQTIGLDIAKVDGLADSDIDPHRLNPVIERDIPETIRKVNKNAKALIKYQNQKSKWQYYQLIGTQATPVDYKNRTDDSNYFMANYVIESDLLLTNFHGKFSDPFNPKIQNVALGKKTFNMGGCMGCHGIAQKNGSDFSFLVADANFDRPDLYLNYEEALLKATNSIYTTVSSKKDWEDTGIMVKAGDVITYELGKWTVNPGTDNGRLYDANGVKPMQIAPNQFVLPKAPIGGLVGKVGTYPAFFIGDNPTAIRAKQSGKLKLSINDLFGAFSDNKGSVTVKIQIK